MTLRAVIAFRVDFWQQMLTIAAEKRLYGLNAPCSALPLKKSLEPLTAAPWGL
jgi:hypothetical protein